MDVRPAPLTLGRRAPADRTGAARSRAACSVGALATVVLLSVLAACADTPAGSPDAATDAAPHEDAATTLDARPDDDDAAPADAVAEDAAAEDASEPRPPDVCDALGLPRVAFVPDGTGVMFGDRAGDFTVHGLDGAAWNLREQWTGCESYVFLVYYVGAYGDSLFTSEVENMLRNASPNLHYFFASYEPDEEARRTRLEALKARIDTAIIRRFATDEEQAAQLRRVHYVVDRITEVEGSVGALVRDYNDFARTNVLDLGDGRRASPPALHVFGVDRAQRWDPGDNLNEYVGGPVLFDMARYLGAFYDYKAALEARVAAQRDARTVSLVDTTTTARQFFPRVTLPDAASLAAYDTLEVDVRIVCPARNPFGCSEWDRIASVHLCVDEACTTRRELARWITPYWRRGEQRWVIDASPLLGLLREGGARRFLVETGPTWERPTEYLGQVSLRFSTAGGKPLAAGAVPAFGGGTFDATYNQRAPLVVDIPADARRVELVTLLSGHGQVAGNNCAEWCDHRHQFTVNGTALPALAPAAGTGSTRGCAERARDGVPPGQWGNWGPQRAYWCPGLPVPAQATDITALVTPGMPATVAYRGSFAAREPAGGDIALSSYVVWYR